MKTSSQNLGGKINHLVNNKIGATWKQIIDDLSDKLKGGIKDEKLKRQKNSTTTGAWQYQSTLCKGKQRNNIYLIRSNINECEERLGDNRDFLHKIIKDDFKLHIYNPITGAVKNNLNTFTL